MEGTLIYSSPSRQQYDSFGIPLPNYLHANNPLQAWWNKDFFNKYNALQDAKYQAALAKYQEDYNSPGNQLALTRQAGPVSQLMGSSFSGAPAGSSSYSGAPDVPEDSMAPIQILLQIAPMLAGVYQSLAETEGIIADTSLTRQNITNSIYTGELIKSQTEYQKELSNQVRNYQNGLLNNQSSYYANLAVAKNLENKKSALDLTKYMDNVDNIWKMDMETRRQIMLSYELGNVSDSLSNEVQRFVNTGTFIVDGKSYNVSNIMNMDLQKVPPYVKEWLLSYNLGSTELSFNSAQTMFLRNYQIPYDSAKLQAFRSVIGNEKEMVVLQEKILRDQYSMNRFTAAHQKQSYTFDRISQGVGMLTDIVSSAASLYGYGSLGRASLMNANTLRNTAIENATNSFIKNSGLNYSRNNVRVRGQVRGVYSSSGY